MKLRFSQAVLNLLSGAIDIHIHSAPDLYPRILNDIELAIHAQEMGMAAIVIKNHFTETAGRAQLTADATGFRVFGELHSTSLWGGLDPTPRSEQPSSWGPKPCGCPRFILSSLWPTRATWPTWPVRSEQSSGYLYPEGRRIPQEELYPIFDLIIEARLLLATGHVSIEASQSGRPGGRQTGVKKIVVTHPLASFLNYTVEDMKEILDLGATWLEHVFNDTTRQVGHPITRDALFSGIKAVGAKHCIMSTDAGQWLNPVPCQQMGIYIQDMLHFGFSEEDIRTMVSDNPGAMLGLCRTAGE